MADSVVEEPVVMRNSDSDALTNDEQFLSNIPTAARLPLISGIRQRSHLPDDVLQREGATLPGVGDAPSLAAYPYAPPPAPSSPRRPERSDAGRFGGRRGEDVGSRPTDVYPEIGADSDRERLLERAETASGFPVEKSQNSQGSLVTILSLWTTMMGSSLLVLPWAIQEAGLALGVCLVFVMGALAFFPTTLIYKAADYLQTTTGVTIVEFQDICARLLGVRLAFVSLLVSLLNLIGAMVVYWILMSAMLYQIGCYFYELQYPETANITDPATDLGPQGRFARYWNELLTVPFYLVFLLLPLICIRNPTFFTKLSSFGIVSILYMIVFVSKKVSDWGWNASSGSPGFELFNGHFPALTGTLSMGFFIHNCILGMTTHHANPQHRKRDTGIAFLMAAVCYAFVGGCYYAAFPVDKHLIADNLLKNFANQEIMALVARCLLFFQMFTVFPLLAYLFRVQLFNLFGHQNVRLRCWMWTSVERPCRPCSDWPANRFTRAARAGHPCMQMKIWR
ncbi:sodium-coupled neutral amino acid transporter 9 homolog isoform X1 [Paramacrobiotus metropolitanus]|uniref:sodium-coupled neutral amino acid transporter 9 homolog isoform X1 n=1 Tax=Paramacrobiotus metropolitanus TaxID=2943436 RepID=UPI0024456400|nr:sodium-coupled neutral amino acid transporter 9 homolog isoform X1 [Paramacrobiotus metropolitanus]